jgi:hypothetical protein
MLGAGFRFPGSLLSIVNLKIIVFIVLISNLGG